MSDLWNLLQFLSERIRLVLSLILGYVSLCSCYLLGYLRLLGKPRPTTLVFFDDNFFRRVNADPEVLCSCCMRTLSKWIADTRRQHLFLVDSIARRLRHIVYNISFDLFNGLPIIGNRRLISQRKHHFIELVWVSGFCSPVVSLSHSLHLWVLRRLNFRRRHLRWSLQISYEWISTAYAELTSKSRSRDSRCITH